MVDLSVDLPLILIQLGTFLLGMVLIWFVFLKGFSKKMQDRADLIKNTIEAAEKQKIDVEKLKLDYENQLETIEKKYQEKIREATKEGTEIKNSIVLQAREEAKVLLEKTKEKLGIEKEKMLKEMRLEVAGLGIKIAEKVIKESVNKETQDRIIADIVKEVERTDAG
ncbi:MAG: ATP synthase F0 subunit B [Candidatus Firestonebacteria bacterium GWA2_43_8]|nr:MAG: ATP synthase F0 subunit B [Candidatus Firestonebacteria bacterium GWA2_43_8]